MHSSWLLENCFGSIGTKRNCIHFNSYKIIYDHKLVNNPFVPGK